jgi:hypothetical protein
LFESIRKLTALDAVPPAGVTVTRTRLELRTVGTLTEILVLVQEDTLAETVPNFTTPERAKPVPEIVSRSPACA